MNALERSRAASTNGEWGMAGLRNSDLRKLLALADAILAVNAHIASQPDTTVTDEVMGKWADDLCKLEAPVEEALAALTEPTP